VSRVPGTAASDRRQFFDVLEAVWALDTDPTAKLVALRLAKHWPHIFPGVQDIAHHTSLDERTVRRALKRLRDDGVILVHKRHNNSSIYEFPGVAIPALGNKPPLPEVPGTAPPPGAESKVPGTAPARTGHSARSGPGTAPYKLSIEESIEGSKECEARTLLPHEESEKRKLERAEPTPGTTPVFLHKFPKDWNPSDAHIAKAMELGISPADFKERVEHARLKTYVSPFTDPDDQFSRELLFLRTDLQTKKFKDSNRKAANEYPGRNRSVDDDRPAPVFGRVRPR
jgi:DNA-binding transcriptional ArsR family regulator